MELEQAIRKLNGDRQFNSWKKSRANAYFSYAFRMFLDSEDDWQIGYYDKDNDKITTFVVKENAVDMKSEEDVFKEESTSVLPIDKSKLKLKLDKIMDKAKKFQSSKYPKEIPVKIISILQNLDNIGTIWNITYITASFNTLNMKIKADDGSIAEHKLLPLLSFKKDDTK